MTHQQQTTFENIIIVGKGEIVRNEQFLLFPQCFLLNQIFVSPSVHIFKSCLLLMRQSGYLWSKRLIYSLLMFLVWTNLKCYHLGLGLTFTVLEPSSVALADSADQDRTAQNVQSDLDLHCPLLYYMLRLKQTLNNNIWAAFPIKKCSTH